MWKYIISAEYRSIASSLSICAGSICLKLVAIVRGSRVMFVGGLQPLSRIPDTVCNGRVRASPQGDGAALRPLCIPTNTPAE